MTTNTEREELIRKLQECRSSIKFNRNSFDRLVLKKEQDGSVNQVDRDELKRLDDLLDYIDALPEAAALLAEDKEDAGGGEAVAWRDAVEKLASLRTFLLGWQLSEGCKRNDMVAKVDQWIAGIDELYNLYTHPQQDKGGEPVGLGGEWTPCVKLPIIVHVRKQRPGEAHVSTREGITPVRPDDLIMRGVQGEEYPIGRELWEKTYTTNTRPQPAQQPMTPDELADKCEAWLQAGGASNIVERGYRECEAANGIKGEA